MDRERRLGRTEVSHDSSGARTKPAAIVAGAVLGGLAALLAVVAYLALVPLGLGRIRPHPQPAASYAEAAQRVDALLAAEGPAFNPVCRTKFWTHGDKTARAVVLIHGYTFCPAMYRLLGQQLYDLVTTS